MRSSTGVGRFCEMDATTPNTMNRMMAGARNAAEHPAEVDEEGERIRPGLELPLIRLLENVLQRLADMC